MISVFSQQQKPNLDTLGPNISLQETGLGLSLALIAQRFYPPIRILNW